MLRAKEKTFIMLEHTERDNYKTKNREIKVCRLLFKTITMLLHESSNNNKYLVF